jgi:hypothetical protein
MTEEKKPPEPPPDEDQPKPPIEEPPVEEPPPRNRRNEKTSGLVNPKESVGPFFSKNVVLRYDRVTTDL